MVCFLHVSPSKRCKGFYFPPHRPYNLESINIIIFSKESQIVMTSGRSERKLIGWKAKVSLRKYVMGDNEGKKPRDKKTWEEFRRKFRKFKLKTEI
jgi:hypothetical protein